MHRVVIIGGGPAGLTAAVELCRLQLWPIVLERRELVGGLARTENYKGFHFDIGGHRFFTKVEEVENLWHEMLGDDFLRRPRLSRIYYNRRYFYYPLRPLNALTGLGVWQSALIALSYLKWQVLPYPEEETFEQWVTNRFGKRLFEIFFRTYTEKVWGIPCSELRAEWAAQRIKDLSLKSALLSMFIKPEKTIKTLIEEFHYPRLGPGMMWSAVKKEVERRGGAVQLGSDVLRICRNGKRITSAVVSFRGSREVVEGEDFISSMPITEFLGKLDPPPPARVLEAAQQLKYRDFLTVCLIIDQPDLFPDNWIYVHEPAVKVGRIQNFKNWSPDMVPDPSKTSLGLEYFCEEGDATWNATDEQLIETGKREVEKIGLARYSDIVDGCVVRNPKAYPVYDSTYGDCLAVVREFLEGLENFQTIGRNGLHRYNNQDHAMLTGLLAARNLALGERNDMWSVNTDQEYHEEISTEGEIVEEEATLAALQETLARAFGRLDRVAFGASVGAVTGVGLCLLTLYVALTGSHVVVSNLALLRQYFPGYSVGYTGSGLGLVYGGVVGFVGGWLFALFRNCAVFLYMTFVRHRAELGQLKRIFDYL